MNNTERKELGLPYCYDDPALLGKQHIYQDKMITYNMTLATEVEKRQSLLKEVFAEAGEGCTVETPLNANWGCKHVHLGKGIYINSNVTFVDDEHIYIGDYSMISPNVVFTTSGHPVLPILRENHYVYNLPIHVGRNVWIGSGCQIMPGISIGDNSVIGAGSVVTHDIPSNVVAFGVPCRVVREIGEKDRQYYYKDRVLDVWE
ncbi:MAG: sugar O-acetyltransferase [Lachnospiraceae bacterium]|nr:sugar O-acetyltransferase [Lachnospiraceae bacterium]MBO5146654.1 sugar O-acetyltransferase [Lachnospiraceae bacterium]